MNSIREREIFFGPDAKRKLLEQSIALSARPIPMKEIEEAVKIQLSCSEDHFHGSWHSMCNMNLENKLKDLQTPTLIVAASADNLLKSNLRDFMLLPNASLCVFNRVSHGVTREVGEQLAENILDFLENGVVNFKTVLKRLQSISSKL